MKRELIALAVVIIAFLVYSVKKAFDYTWSIRNFKIYDIGNYSISGIIQVDIYNPSPLSAKVSQYKLDLLINNIYVTTVSGIGPYHLKEQSTTPIDINFNLNNIPNLAALIGPSILINKATNIKFAGPVTINTRGINKTININFERPLSYYFA